MHFWKLSWKTFGQKAKNLPLNVPKKRFLWKNSSSNCLFKKKQDSSKCSYGHVEYSFENFGEIFWIKGRKIVSQCPKLIQNFQKIFLQTLLWTRRMQFWQLSQKLLNRRQQLCRWLPKKKTIFFSGKYSIKIFRWKRKKLFLQPRRNFLQWKAETFLLTVLKGWKTVFFWKNSLLEIIPTYTKNAVLTCVPKFFPHKAANVSLKVQKRCSKMI